MTIVNYAGLNLHKINGTYPAAKPGREEEVGDPPSFRFQPGANDVPDDLWNLLKEVPACKALLADHTLTVATLRTEKGKGNAPPSTKEVDIGSTKAADSIKLIESIMDDQLLERYKEQEEGRKAGPRQSVLDAITLRMTDLKGDDGRADDKDEGHVSPVSERRKRNSAA